MRSCVQYDEIGRILNASKKHGCSSYEDICSANGGAQHGGWRVFNGHLRHTGNDQYRRAE